MRRRTLARAALVFSLSAGSIACARLIGLTDGEPRDDGAMDATDGGDATSATDAPTTTDGATDARPFTQLALGASHSCALVMPSGAVRCWGSNQFYRLGNDRFTGLRNSPRGAAALNFGANWQTQTIVAGASHTCALSADHRVKCWGAGLSGQLGIGPLPRTTENGIESGAPLDEKGDGSQVDLGSSADPIALAAGMNHTCAILRPKDGSRTIVKCWGSNNKGALGLGLSKESVSTVGLDKNDLGELLRKAQIPSSVGAPTLIAAGYDFTCVTLGSDNQVSCWGDNGFDQLGIPSVTYPSVGAAGDMDKPYQDGVSPFLPGGRPAMFLAIPVNGTHVCAAHGSFATCWGSNAFAQAGAPVSALDAGTGGAAKDRPSISIDGVTSQTITSLATGSGFSCATYEDGAARCWGANDAGQLGRGTVGRFAPPSSQPIDLGKGVRAERVYAGGSHACVVTQENQVKCWGSNASGQLGTGDTTDRGGKPETMGDALVPLPLE